MRRTSWMHASCAAVAATLLVSPAFAQEEPKPLVRDVDPPDSPDSKEQPAATEYWLGVRALGVDEVLRSYLNLPDGQGVLVETLVPDSPAAKAGLQKNDILLALNDQPLGDPIKLVEAVKTSQGKELAFKVLRAGKEETIKVTPAARPASTTAGQVAPSSRTPQDALRFWLAEEVNPLRLRMFRDGFTLLADDMTVTIVRHGKEPAKITVKKGDQTWEVTDKELDKLPADVRQHVEQMIDPHPFGIAVEGPSADGARFAPRPFTIPLQQPPQIERDPHDPTIVRDLKEMERRMQKQMEELQRTMEEMRKSIEEMRTKPKETT